MKIQTKQFDWTRLFQAFHLGTQWTFEIAARLAREYPEEVATVERVRHFVRARIAGHPAEIAIDDVLFTFGLVVGAIEQDE